MEHQQEMQDLKLSASSSPGLLLPGGFWRRFLASLIDAITLSILSALVSIPLTFVAVMQAGSAASPEQLGGNLILNLLNWAVNLGFAFAYYGWFYSRKGASPGKMILGLRVVQSETGANPTFWQAALRDTLGKFLSAIIVMVGYLMVAFRGDKKALHDLVFSTQVLHRES